MNLDRILAANIVGFILLIFGKAFLSLGEPFLSVGFFIPAGLCFIVAIILIIQDFLE